MKTLSFLSVGKRYLVWALVAAALVVAAKRTLLASPTVHAVPVERRDLTAQVYGNGTVEAKVVVDVSSKITGRIVALYADQGDRVKGGQLLARLEAEDAAQQVLQAEAGTRKASAAVRVEEANLRKARANLELAERNAGRYRNLAEKELVPRIEAENHETSFRVAREEVERCLAALEAARMEQEAARAGLGVAGSRRTDTLIHAPQDGMILSRELETGATLAPGLPIFRLASPGAVWVKAYVDESQLAGITEGKPATITLRSSPGKKLAGRVARLGRESDRVTEELEVDVTFDPALASFHLGEQAEVLIAADARRGVPSLPASAIVSRGKSRGVWALRNGSLLFREVAVGIEDRDGHAEVSQGLEAGDTVVVAPPERMRKFKDGMKVKVAS